MDIVDVFEDMLAKTLYDRDKTFDEVNASLIFLDDALDAAYSGFLLHSDDAIAKAVLPWCSLEMAEA